MMHFMKRPKLTRAEKDFLSILYLMYSKMIWYVSVKILKDRELPLMSCVKSLIILMSVLTIW